MSGGVHGESDLVGGRLSGGGSSRVERAGALVYERYGPWGLFGVSGASAVATAVLNVALVMVFMSRYLHVPSGDLLRLIGLAEALNVSGCLIGTLLTYRLIRVALSWRGTGRNSARAPEVWNSLIKVPNAVVTRVGVAIALLETITVAAAVQTVHAGLATAVPVFAVVVLVCAANCVFVAYGIETLVRVAVEDLVQYLPTGFTPSTRSLSLRAKVLVPIPGATIYAALCAGAFAGASHDVAGRLYTALGIGLGLSGIAVVMFLVSTRSALDPIDRLSAATMRVAGGDLHATVPLTTADELGQLGESFNNMLTGLRERESLHGALGSYVDPVIAERVLNEGIRLSGEAADVTIMFVDIVGFTALAEQAIPEEVVSDLNDFFDLVVPVIERHGGHANKLLGDGLLAVFGVPIPLDHHADQALAAAQEIDQRLAERYDGKLRAGIGLNSGTVVAGSMGSGRKLDYTVIGDPVNVAARVEALTRQTGDSILLTEATRQALSDPSVELDERGSTPVKGRSREIALYALPNTRSGNPDADPLGTIGHQTPLPPLPIPQNSSRGGGI